MQYHCKTTFITCRPNNIYYFIEFEISMIFFSCKYIYKSRSISVTIEMNIGHV